MNEPDRIRILGIPVDMVDNSQAMKIFEGLMLTPECDLIVTPNSEIIMNATKDSALKFLIEEANLIIPDGIGIVYASRFKGVPLKERVTGVDFLSQAFEYLRDHGQSVYLLGSKPANELRDSVAALAGEKIKETYPGIRIAGTHHGYFSEQDEADLVEDINNSGADFLCVALGAPKQEKFIYEHKDQFTNVRAAIGVGGSLDVWAGTVKRAPLFYQKHGMEWLYRFAREPSRYKRIAQLPLFMVKVIKEGKELK